MAPVNKLPLKARNVYLGAYDISGFSRNVMMGSALQELPSTAYGDAATNNESGLPTVSATIDVMMPTTFAWDAAIFGARGAKTPLTFFIEGNSAGNVALTVYGLECKYAPGLKIGDIMANQLAIASKGQEVVRGLVLENGANKVASGDGNGVQLGAVASGKSLFLAYHVLLMTATSVAGVLKSATSGAFSSPTTRITTTTWTGIGSELLSVAGPITDTWYRLTWTLVGSGAFQIAAAIAAQ